MSLFSTNMAVSQTKGKFKVWYFNISKKGLIHNDDITRTSHDDGVNAFLLERIVIYDMSSINSSESRLILSQNLLTAGATSSLYPVRWPDTDLTATVHVFLRLFKVRTSDVVTIHTTQTDTR